MHRGPAAVAALLALAPWLSPPASAAGEAGRPSGTGRLIVLAERATGQPGAARAAIAAAGARAGAVAAPEIGVATARPRRGEPLAAAARRIAAQPGVARVERDRRRMRLRALPDDPALAARDPLAGSAGAGLPPGARLAWPLLRERFPAAWEITRGERALVAVIDSGVDAAHPELAGKLAALVDQQHPGDRRGPAGVDKDGHGTHVASLACAATGNGVGLAGAGHDCRLLIEKTDLSDASIAAAIVDATDRGAHAINMSFGSDGREPASAAVRRAVRYAARHDVVLVAAAADDPVKEQGDPANLLQPTGSGPRLDAGIGLSVTAAGYSGGRAWFAGRGTQVSLAAYGAAGPRRTEPAGVLGALPAGRVGVERGRRPCRCRTSVAGDARYGYLQGTSMAAPRVAAAAAMMRALNPDLRGREVVRMLKQTASRRGGWSAEVGWGVLDAGRALAAARAADRRAPASSVATAPGGAPGQVRLRVSAADAGPPGVRVSGVAAVEVLAVRVSGGQETRLRLRPGRRSITFAGVPGKRYRFTSLARDRAGNAERRPARADATARATRPARARRGR